MVQTQANKLFRCKSAMQLQQWSSYLNSQC